LPRHWRGFFSLDNAFKLSISGCDKMRLDGEAMCVHINRNAGGVLMLKISGIVFVMAAPTLMGILAVAVMATPSLMNEGGKWIMAAAGIGFLLSVPVSYFIGKSIDSLIKKG